jgi:hypothetical protein
MEGLLQEGMGLRPLGPTETRPLVASIQLHCSLTRPLLPLPT